MLDAEGVLFVAVDVHDLVGQDRHVAGPGPKGHPKLARLVLGRVGPKLLVLGRDRLLLPQQNLVWRVVPKNQWDEKESFEWLLKWNR